MEPHWKKLGGGWWERGKLSNWDGIGVEEPLKFLFTRLARENVIVLPMLTVNFAQFDTLEQQQFPKSSCQDISWWFN
ncbi:hypothetical protein Pyn_08394 [Prunus yedoensis var. nudiflora]|uniref:Uncharacterized protein n=1 Tax=Prunus yedoensis var. nudiflora TaxID=2094558 RepID=A0A314XXY3_PRUYE|nr:hypothetical protein Pyn_08394 [Prunus yedoensis var. nudiflora]